MVATGVIIAERGDPASRWPLDRSSARHLLPIANRPILLHAIEGMGRAGIGEVAIIAPPDAHEAIQTAIDVAPPTGVALRLLTDARPRGPVSALATAAEFAEERPFLLQAGDGLLRDDVGGLIDRLQVGGADAFALVGREGARPVGAPAPLLDLGGRRAASRGAHVFAAGFAGRARDHLRRRRDDQDLHRLFEDLRRGGARVEARPVRWWGRFDGDPRALLRMNEVVLDELDPGPAPVVAGCRIEGRVLLDPTAQVEGSVIHGPAVIGRHARIIDAYVGPYTAIGHAARVENAEIAQSIVFDAAEILRVSDRLEGCVIGRGARVTREFALPRALRLHLGDGAQVALH